MGLIDSEMVHISSLVSVTETERSKQDGETPRPIDLLHSEQPANRSVTTSCSCVYQKKKNDPDEDSQLHARLGRDVDAAETTR